jgi:hypothetical protein
LQEGNAGSDTLATINSFGGLGTAVIMIIGYLLVLYHIRTGSQYKAITYITLWLIMSCTFGILTAITFYNLNIVDGEMSVLMIWLSGVAFTLQQLPFNVSHFELAWIYRKLSKDVPKAIKIAEREGQTERVTFSDLEPENERKKEYHLIMWCNVIFPILSGIADVVYYYSIKNPLD